MFRSRLMMSIVGMALAGVVVPDAQAQSKVEIQAMDRDDDGVVVRSEWQGAGGAFRLHDTNKDGVLSGTEVWEEGDQRGRRRHDEKRFDNWTASSFASLDRNRDNRIIAREWTFDLPSFNFADRDHDNVVSRAEFLGAAERRRDRVNGADRVSSNAYRAGYARGESEGHLAGREDRDRNQGWDLEGQRELEQADSGFTEQMGPKADYQAGYRDGFRLAYREGWERR